MPDKLSCSASAGWHQMRLACGLCPFIIRIVIIIGPHDLGELAPEHTHYMVREIAERKSLYFRSVHSFSVVKPHEDHIANEPINLQLPKGLQPVSFPVGSGKSLQLVKQFVLTAEGEESLGASSWVASYSNIKHSLQKN